MSLKKHYKPNLPQLFWGRLSENWLLKELGDLHWEQITTSLNTDTDKLTDSRGERLYASFVRLQWSGANLSCFKENNKFQLDSQLSRYGSKMFFSETDGKGKSGVFKANLMSVFSSRKDTDNTTLKNGTLKSSEALDNVKSYDKLPPLASEYLKNKSRIFKKKDPVTSIYQQEYLIDANGGNLS